jgi:hypothetical protein
VREPEGGAEPRVAVQEDVDDPPEPRITSRVRGLAEGESRERRVAQRGRARARLLDRLPERRQGDEGERPDAEADEAEAVERAAGGRRGEGQGERVAPGGARPG